MKKLWFQFGLSSIYDDATTASESFGSVCDSAGIDTKFHASARRSAATNAIQSRCRWHEQSCEKCN